MHFLEGVGRGGVGGGGREGVIISEESYRSLQKTLINPLASIGDEYHQRVFASKVWGLNNQGFRLFYGLILRL